MAASPVYGVSHSVASLACPAGDEHQPPIRRPGQGQVVLATRLRPGNSALPSGRRDLRPGQMVVKRGTDWSSRAQHLSGLTTVSGGTGSHWRRGRAQRQRGRQHPLANNLALVFANPSPALHGMIGGSGSLIKIAAGTLQLTGNHTSPRVHGRQQRDGPARRAPIPCPVSAPPPAAARPTALQFSTAQ